MSRLFSMKSFGLSVLAAALAVTFTPAAHAQPAVAPSRTCHKVHVDHEPYLGAASLDANRMVVPKGEEVCTEISPDSGQQEKQRPAEPEEQRQPDTEPAQ
jgi:hypothetical protein